MLICDSCTRGYHLECFGMSDMPESDQWACNGCSCLQHLAVGDHLVVESPQQLYAGPDPEPHLTQGLYLASVAKLGLFDRAAGGRHVQLITTAAPLPGSLRFYSKHTHKLLNRAPKASQELAAQLYLQHGVTQQDIFLSSSRYAMVGSPAAAADAASEAWLAGPNSVEVAMQLPAGPAKQAWLLGCAEVSSNAQHRASQHPSEQQGPFAASHPSEGAQPYSTSAFAMPQGLPAVPVQPPGQGLGVQQQGLGLVIQPQQQQVVPAVPVQPPTLSPGIQQQQLQGLPVAPPLTPTQGLGMQQQQVHMAGGPALNPTQALSPQQQLQTPLAAGTPQDLASVLAQALSMVLQQQVGLPAAPVQALPGQQQISASWAPYTSPSLASTTAQLGQLLAPGPALQQVLGLLAAPQTTPSMQSNIMQSAAAAAGTPGHGTPAAAAGMGSSGMIRKRGSRGSS